MRGFFKTFFAAFLAIVVFAILGFFLLIGFIASATSSDKPVVGRNAVLVLDLTNKFNEQPNNNPVNALLNGADDDMPSLYDMVRMLHHAKADIERFNIITVMGCDH